MTVKSSGTVNTSKVGKYTITYTATDAAGNKATKTRTVNVVDTTAPVITVKGANTVTVSHGSAYTDAGATATDNVDPAVTVTSSGTVDTATEGTYTITYTATDAAGNTATETRTVTVVIVGAITYKVVLNTTEKLGGYEVKLKFKNDLPSETNVSLDNSALEANGRNVNDLGPKFDESAKTIYFGAWSMGSEDGVSGDMEVMTFKTEDSSSNITVLEPIFTDKDANEISGTVSIEVAK